MRKIQRLLFVALSLILFFSCKKWEDQKAQPNPLITARKYCNDPLAVNYNWGFPGTPDNTTCYYPTDIFKGDYVYQDSVFDVNMNFDSVRSQTSYVLHVIPTDKYHFRVVGFCSNNDSLKFTGERSTFKASADTTIKINDSTYAYGQFCCSSLDTLTGYFSKNMSDSIHLKVNFMIVSDTGINYHIGTAIKQ